MKDDKQQLISKKQSLRPPVVSGLKQQKKPVAAVNKLTGPVNTSKSVKANVFETTEAKVNVAFKPFENSIFDTRGLLRMMDDLSLIERSLFRGKDAPISQKAKDFTNSSILNMFEDLEKTGLESLVDREQLKFLKDLQNYLISLPQVKLTLAFAPTNTFLEKLSNQISTVVGQKTLIDLIVDEYIVGGAVFEYKGKISRQTLDIKLEEALGKHIEGLGGGTQG